MASAPTPPAPQSNGPTVLFEGAAPIIADLVFVHGLRGDPIETWTSGSVCWPRDLLKEDFPNVRVITWGYDSSVVKATESASQASLFAHAGNLLLDISGKRRGAAEKSRPIIFLAHSLGGLVVKEALLRSCEYLHNGQNTRQAAIYSSTKAIIFFGTPHRGSSKTSLAGFVSFVAKAVLKKPNDKLIEALSQDSQILEKQRNSFSGISRNLSLTCLWEENPMSIGIIVPEYSATIDGFNVTTGSIPDDHVRMCKFSSRDDVGYSRTRGFLDDVIDVLVEESGSGGTPSA